MAIQVLYGADDNFIGQDNLTKVKNAFVNCNAGNLRWEAIAGGGHECWRFGKDTTHAIWDYIRPSVAKDGIGFPVVAPTAVKPIQQTAISTSAISSNDLVEVIGLNGQVVSRCKAIGVRNMKNGGVRLIRVIGAAEKVEKVYLNGETR